MSEFSNEITQKITFCGSNEILLTNSVMQSLDKVPWEILWLVFRLKVSSIICENFFGNCIVPKLAGNYFISNSAALTPQSTIKPAAVRVKSIENNFL